MLYYDFKVGDKEYKLRLNTRTLITLETKLKKNPVLIFINPENKNAPTIEQMITILEVALKEYHPDVDAYELFDEWLASGNLVGEFTQVIVDLYKLCGLIKSDEDQKN